jgi:hypothetical protein
MTPEEHKRALASVKATHRWRQRNLLDPRWKIPVSRFPYWKPGMTTEEYIAAFERTAHLTKVEWLHARRHPAPWNDNPDVVEEAIDGS